MKACFLALVLGLVCAALAGATKVFREYYYYMCS